MKRTETTKRVRPFTAVTRPVIPSNGPSASLTSDPFASWGHGTSGSPICWSLRIWTRSWTSSSWSGTARTWRQRFVFRSSIRSRSTSPRAKR